MMPLTFGDLGVKRQSLGEAQMENKPCSQSKDGNGRGVTFNQRPQPAMVRSARTTVKTTCHYAPNSKPSIWIEY